MRFDVITIFPEMFAGPFAASIIYRAIERGLIDLHVHNLRNWATDRHRTTDDYTFGGGTGMVMKPEPVFAAVESLVPVADPQCEVILLSPQGAPLNQPLARELARKRRLVLICGHYEGFDERIRQHLGTRAVSIGDYVLTGGEIPAMVLIDCVGRLVDGVLPADATEAESHTENLLEYPQYTRPATFRQWAVPEVLLSGNHERIAAWRRLQALKRTRELRPDLWQQLELTERDRKLLAEDEEAGDE